MNKGQHIGVNGITSLDELKMLQEIFSALIRSKKAATQNLLRLKVGFHVDSEGFVGTKERPCRNVGYKVLSGLAAVEDEKLVKSVHLHLYDPTTASWQVDQFLERAGAGVDSIELKINEITYPQLLKVREHHHDLGISLLVDDTSFARLTREGEQARSLLIGYCGIIDGVVFDANHKHTVWDILDALNRVTIPQDMEVAISGMHHVNNYDRLWRLESPDNMATCEARMRRLGRIVSLEMTSTLRPGEWTKENEEEVTTRFLTRCVRLMDGLYPDPLPKAMAA